MDGEEAFWHFIARVGIVHTRVCELLAKIADKKLGGNKPASESPPEGKPQEISEKLEGHTT